MRFHAIYRRYKFSPIVQCYYESDNGSIISKTSKNVLTEKYPEVLQKDVCNIYHGQTPLIRGILSKAYNYLFEYNDCTLVVIVHNYWFVIYCPNYIQILGSDCETRHMLYKNYEMPEYRRVGFIKTYIPAISTCVYPYAILYDEITNRYFNGEAWLSVPNIIPIDTKKKLIYYLLLKTQKEVYGVIKGGNENYFVDKEFNIINIERGV